ncbi:MAG: phosphotransferase [Pseudomonadota bacterium]
MVFALGVESAVHAALSVARRIGLRADSARPISLVGRAVFLIEPCLVVAKVSPLVDKLRCETEIALATHVVCQEGPVVSPLLRGEPGPYVFADAAVTLWEHCPLEADARTPGHAAGTAYSQLVPHLQSYGGVLPDFRVPIRDCGRAVEHDGLGRLSGGALDLLRNEFEGLEQLDLPQKEMRNLHGDPHLGNLTLSEGRALWLDLKAACTGPPEWDLTALPASAGLDPRRPDLFKQLQRLRSACVVVWCARKEKPAPMELEAIRIHLERLAGQCAV